MYVCIYNFLINILKIYLFILQRERASWTDSQLSSEPDSGLDLMILRSWPELKTRVGHPTDWATQASHESHSFKMRNKTGHWMALSVGCATLGLWLGSWSPGWWHRVLIRALALSGESVWRFSPSALSPTFSLSLKNKLIFTTFAATWMGLEEIMLNEISQAEKDNYHMVSLIYGT